MDAETARTVHLSILAAGAVVWLLALWFHRRSFRPPDPVHPDVTREGEVELAAPRARVRDRILEALRVRTGGLGGSFLIENATDRRIEGRAGIVPSRMTSRQSGFEVDLSERGGGTRVTWRVTRGGGSWLRRVSALFVYVLSPLALAAAAWVMQSFVLPSEEPAVRAQAVQTLQVIHVLWPPFLFAGLGRRTDRLIGSWLETTIRNAAF